MTRLVAILLLVALCAGALLAAEVPALMEQLKSDDADTRWAAVEGLAQAGPAAIEPIFDLLSAGDRYYLPAQVALRQVVSRAGRPGADAERTAVAAAILTQMRPDRSAVAKRFGLEMLSQIAGEANAPALGRLLFDPEVGEMARWALVRMPGQAATDALVQGLHEAASSDRRVAMLGALGARKSAGTVSTIALYLDRDYYDEPVRLAALQALARIPSAEAAAALAARLGKGTAAEQAEARRSYLQSAETLALAGRGREALAVCRKMLALDPSEQEACRVMSVLGQSGDGEAIALLCNNLASRNDIIRGAARNALVAARGNAGSVIAARLKNADPGLAVTLAWILGERRERGDSVAALVAAMAGGSEAFQAAACQALGKIGDPGAASTLLAALSDPRESIQEAAEAALARLPGPGVTAQIITALQRPATGEFRAALVRSLGYRTDKEAAPVLVSLAEDKEPAVRATAITALAGRHERAAYEELYLAKARDGDDGVAAAALQALTRMKSEKAEPLFVEMAKSGGESAKSAALYGYLVLADKRKAADKPAALAMFKEALTLAGDDDNNQRLALAGMADLADASCLPLVAPCLEKEGTRQAAAPVLMPIAADLMKAGDKQQAIDLYQKVIAASGNPRILQDAARALRELGVEVDLAGQAGFITHWWVAGPFQGRSRWSKEDAFDVSKPIDVGTPIALEGKQFAWKPVLVEDPSGGLDFRQAVAQADEVAAYAYAEVTSAAAQEVILSMGSDDGIVVWVNGKKVHTNLTERGYAPDQDRATVTLKPGANQILMKVINGGADWMGGIRIVNVDGEPVRLEQRKQ